MDSFYFIFFYKKMFKKICTKQMKLLLNVRPKGKDLNLVYSLYMYFNNDFVLVGAKSFFASVPTFVTEVEFSLCAEQQILLKLNRYIFFFAIVLFLSFSTLYLAKKTIYNQIKFGKKTRVIIKTTCLVLGSDIVFIENLQLYPGFLPFIN